MHEFRFQFKPGDYIEGGIDGEGRIKECIISLGGQYYKILWLQTLADEISTAEYIETDYHLIE
jgi:hypothetical protein